MNSEQTLFPVKTRFVEKYPVDKLPTGYATVKPDAHFIESIRVYGVLQPLICKEQPGTDALKLLIGRRRLDAARECEMRFVPVRIFPADWSDDEVESAVAVIENRQRRANAVSDLSQVEKMLDKGKTKEEVRARFMLSKQEMDRLLLLRNNLIKPLRRALWDKVIGVGTAELCAKKTKKVQEQLLDILEEEGQLTKADVAAACKVQKKAAVAALPADLFGDVKTGWKDRVKDLLAEAKEIAEKDGGEKLVNLLAQATEEVK